MAAAGAASASADVVMRRRASTMCLARAASCSQRTARGPRRRIISGETTGQTSRCTRPIEATAAACLPDAAHGAPGQPTVRQQWFSPAPADAASLACMQERFPRFPDACPSQAASQRRRVRSTTKSRGTFRPTAGTAFNFARCQPSTSQLHLTTSSIGTGHCDAPAPLVVDVNAELILGLTRDAWQRVNWQKAGWPRNYTRTGSHPCITLRAGKQVFAECGEGGMANRVGELSNTSINKRRSRSLQLIL